MWRKKICSCLRNKLNFPDNWQGRTDRLLIRIFYNTGVRLTELVTLKNSQVDIVSGNYPGIGKGK